MNTNRTVHYIDVGNMSAKQICNILDPSGKLYKNRVIENIVSWVGISIIVTLKLALLYIIWSN
jgi:hypothetical protein